MIVGGDHDNWIKNQVLSDLENDWCSFACNFSEAPEDADPKKLQDLLVRTYDVLREATEETAGPARLNAYSFDFVRFILGVGAAYGILDAAFFLDGHYIGPKPLFGYACLFSWFWISFASARADWGGGEYVSEWKTTEDGRLAMRYKWDTITVDPKTFALTDDIISFFRESVDME